MFGIRGILAIVTIFSTLGYFVPAHAAIKVGVFQTPNNGGADAAGHVVNQLNDDTYFDFNASLTTNGLLLDTVAELSAYDVIVIGDDGYGGSRVGWNQMGASLKAFVNNGGSLVTTAWTVYWSDLDSDIKDILPVQGAGQYDFNQQLTITNSSHPITTGVSSFFVQSYQNYGSAKSGSTTLGITDGNGAAVAVSTWDYGSGRVVSLAAPYMLSRSGYGSGLNSLETGNGDRLLEQAVAYAASVEEPTVPEPVSLAIWSVLGIVGVATRWSRRRTLLVAAPIPMA